MIANARLFRYLGWLMGASAVLMLAFLAIPNSSVQAQNGDEPSSPDTCASCHTAEYEAWERGQHAGALANPRFIEAWSRAGSPAYCKACHATGYSAADDTVDYEGVGCLTCHTDGEGDHPASDMTVTASPQLCATCHTGNHAPDYDQWLSSRHVTANVGCADCHQSHDTTLRFEDSTQLCTSCHQEADEGLHAEVQTTCTDCHMAPGETVIDPLSGTTNGTGHGFEIPPSVCAKCHSMTHDDLPGQGTTLTTEVAEADEAAEIRETDNRDLDMHLTVAGLGGLMIGMVIPWLLQRRNRHEPDA